MTRLLKVGERLCEGSRLVGRPRKRCTDSTNDCLKTMEVLMLGRREEWCRIEINNWGFRGRILTCDKPKESG